MNSTILKKALEWLKSAIAGGEITLLVQAVTFAGLVENLVKDAKTTLASQLPEGKTLIGEHIVTITNVKPTMVLKSAKELGFTPENNPEMFKERAGYVRVSVK